MLPGAFTRGNSVVFLLGEPFAYCRWSCPQCSLTSSTHMEMHKPSPLNALLWPPRHMLPFTRHFGYMVPQCHCGKNHYCTLFFLSFFFTAHSFYLLICPCLIFYSCIPPVLNGEVGVVGGSSGSGGGGGGGDSLCEGRIIKSLTTEEQVPISLCSPVTQLSGTTLTQYSGTGSRLHLALHTGPHAHRAPTSKCLVIYCSTT